MMNGGRSLKLEPRDPARSIARAAIALGRFGLDRRERPEAFVERNWKNDSDAAWLIRASTTPTTLATAGDLVQIKTAILPMLRPFSAAAQLFENCLSVTFDNTGSVSVPNYGTVGVAFVAENAPKPALQGAGTAATLTPKKIAGIVSVTLELLYNPDIENVMQQLLAESSGPVLDTAVFSANAATASTPAGILNGIAGLTPTVAGSDAFAAYIGDLKKLASAVGAVAGTGDIFFIMSPAQAVSATYRSARENVNVLATGSVVDGTVIAVATNGLVSAMGAPTFATSTEATVQEDSAPGAVMTALTRSLWQTGSVGVKMNLETSWVRRATGAVAWMASVNW